MRTTANTQKDRTTGVNHRTPWKVAKVEALPGYRLHVAFVDGTNGLVDMRHFLTRDCGVFKALRESDVFMQAHVFHGAVTWPGELDLAPDRMHEELQKADVYTMQ